MKHLHRPLLVSVTLTLTLVGCASPQEAQPFIGPNGGTAYSLNCGKDAGYCYEIASSYCINGYSVIGGGHAPGNVVMEITPGLYTRGAGRNTLVIECKATRF